MLTHRIFTIVIFLLMISVSAQKKIDSLSTVLNTLDKSSTRYIDLLNELGFQYWTVDPKQSINNGKTALRLSDSLAYLNGNAKSNRVIGVAYWTQGNYVDALKYLNASFTTYQSINDDEGVANVTLNQGMVYADLNDDEKALTMYEDAINKFTALDLKGRIATTYTKLASLYLEQGKLEYAKVHLDNALHMHSESGYKYGMSEAHNRLGILYLEYNELEQAFYHISKSINMSRDINDANGMTSSLLYFGKLLFMDKQYQFAEDHINLSIQSAKDNGLKRFELLAYEAMRELKTEEEKYEEALLYYDLYTELKDNIFNSERTMQIAAIEFTNQLENKEKELDILKEEERKNRLFQWGLSAGFLGLIISSIWFYFNYKKQTQQREEIEASKELINATALENSKLKQQELQQQLAFKNKELTSYTLNFVQKNELLEQLQEKLELLKTVDTAKQEKIHAQLNRLLKQHINIDKNWQDFKRVFEEVHSNFILKLKNKHPDLSSNDLKISALTRLNLNIKETASMLGISPESAKTARYRLRKKLNLDPNEELLSYFLGREQEKY